MANEQKKAEPKKEPVYSRVVNKFTKDGSIARQVKIVIAEYDFNGIKGKYLQISRSDMGFGSKPGKSSTVNLDYRDPEIRAALLEALDN